jgi:ABC-type branched-subunit amino acid transport system substrate-binding protein
VLKIGLLATLEGPVRGAGPGQHARRRPRAQGKNGMAGGKKIEFVKVSSDATPDKAVNATRKAVEQDKVQIMIGPLSGDEGIAVKNYAKTQPNVTFINGSSGAQAATLTDPSPELLPLQHRRRAVAGRAGRARARKGYKKVYLIAEDYGFPYSQVQGFMASYCAKGGKVVDKAWVPLGTKDYASVIAKIPKDVDALVVVLGGSDAVNFLTQYEQAGGDKPMIGGSITVDQTVLNFKGKRRESLLGTASAGPMADSIDTPSGRSSSPTTRRLQGRLPEPVAVRLPVLHQHEGDARCARRGEGRPVGWPEGVPRGAAEDPLQGPGRRCQDRCQPQRRRPDLHHRGHEGGGRLVLQQGREDGARHHADAGPAGGRVQEDGPGHARRAGLQKMSPPPEHLTVLPLKGAPLADRQSRLRGDRLMGGGPTTLLSGDALALSHVTRAFGALRAVDDVSLNVAAGEKYAILGSNGAGKTTLFNAITGDFPPTAGSVHLFGEDITTLPPHERIRKGLRRTYQSSLLFRDLTVRDNLFLAVRGVANGRFSLLRASAGTHRPWRPTTCWSACASRTSPTSGWPTSRTASSASSRSAWRWRVRRA